METALDREWKHLNFYHEFARDWLVYVKEVISTLSLTFLICKICGSD